VGKRARILVVDDDEIIREALVVLLKEEGYVVDTAENGEEAIEKSNAKFYNLALLDIKLPDMEGTKLLAKMHKNLPKMVKIMVTGYPSLENAIEALNLGADAYILKPIRMDSLLTRIRQHLEKQEEAKKYSEEKVAEFIKTRVRGLEKEKTINL